MRNHSIFALAIIALLAGTTAEAKYCGGDGLAGNPYRICTAENMNEIGANPADWNKHFLLVNDVNLAGFTGTEFYIIGTDNYHPFTGVFDGNNHKVLNFTWTSTGRSCIALFGYVGTGGQIKNLGMENVNVNAVNGSYVGGLVGFNQGTITNCYSTGSVTGGDYTGGLVGVGDYYSTITSCYSTGSVSGYKYVGGLVGYNNYGTITDYCYSTGSVSGNEDVGGLVGHNRCPITNCYSTGNVSGGEYSHYVGGLVGYNSGPITDCYSTGNVSGGEYSHSCRRIGRNQ